MLELGSDPKASVVGIPSHEVTTWSVVTTETPGSTEGRAKQW